MSGLLLGHRYLPRDAGTLASLAPDLERSTGDPGPLLHRRQAQAEARGLPRVDLVDVETLAIVFYDDGEAISTPVHEGRDVRRVRMLRGIGEGLLHDPVHGDLRVARDQAIHLSDVRRYGLAVRVDVMVDQPLQRARQPERVQQAGA